MQKNILITDDDSAIRHMLKTAFSNEGYLVIEASNGAEGLQKAQEHIFDAIITDLKMPQMDGLSFVEQLKKLPNVKETTPIIIFSSVTQDYLKTEAIKKGATAIFVKDQITPNQLISEIRNLLEPGPPQS